VAVQRAYADWRRYPQYIVPAAESSIDMICAGVRVEQEKRDDIPLAVDAPSSSSSRGPRSGTFICCRAIGILLAGAKLKEYGKYVIGVGIRDHRATCCPELRRVLLV